MRPVSQIDDRYRYYMDLIKRDPEAAGRQFVDELMRSPKKTKRTIDTIKQIRQILSGDQEAWQYGSQSIADAMSFAISNALMRIYGLGVLPTGPREDVANVVANIITENVNFIPLTAEQRRMKMLAESYGYSVYLLEDTDEDESPE